MIYLDSEDSFYTINHQQEQEQEEPIKKYSKNDERIGKISLILIIAFVAYIIWTIIDAYAFGQTDLKNQAHSQPTEDDNDKCVHDGLTLCIDTGDDFCVLNNSTKAHNNTMKKC